MSLISIELFQNFRSQCLYSDLGVYKFTQTKPHFLKNNVTLLTISVYKAIIILLVSYLYKLLFYSFYFKLEIFVLGSLKQHENWKRKIHFNTSECKYASENTHAHTHA